MFFGPNGLDTDGIGERRSGVPRPSGVRSGSPWGDMARTEAATGAVEVRDPGRGKAWARTTRRVAVEKLSAA